MLINCVNILDSDTFVINPPSILPIGARFTYSGHCYIIGNIFYDEESGVVSYMVSPDNHNGPKGMDAQVIAYCKNNMRLQAVKYVKETSDLDLKGAKDYVDNICSKYGI